MLNQVKCAVTDVTPVVIPPKNVTITMPLEHAVVLMVVFNAVSGDPCGPRGKIDDIRRAMLDAGVPASWNVHPVGKNGQKSELWLGN